MEKEVNIKDILGKKVVTLSRGEECGTVEKVTYNPRNAKVVILYIQNSSWVDLGKKQVLFWGDVESFGDDAIVIENRRTLKDFDAKMQNLEKVSFFFQEALQDMNILTESGNEVGKVDDVIVEEHTGVMKEIRALEGDYIHTIPIKEVISFGRDYMMVSEYADVDKESEFKDKRSVDNKFLDQGIRTSTAIQSQMQLIRNRLLANS